jgi:hypothetical protein
MKYLGVHIDSHLEFSTHVREISKAAFRRLQIIRRARAYMDHTAAAVLCKSLVLSRLEYCATILSNLTQRDADQLQKIINVAARLVFRARRTEHVTPLLRKLKWPKFQERCVLCSTALVHKALHGSAPLYLTTELERYTPGRSLRSESKGMLVPVYGRRRVGNLIFKVLAAKVWNNLPQVLRTENRFLLFMTTLTHSIFIDQ